MQKNNLFGKIGILISLSVLFLVSAYFGKAVNYFSVLFFSVGIFLGMALLEADEKYAYKYYDPDEKRLVTRSFLFLLSLPPLGLFLLTSTGSAMGVGMFLGIISILSLEFFSFRNNLQGFQKRYLSQLKRDITQDEHAIFTTVFIAATVLFAFLVIFLGR